MMISPWRRRDLRSVHLLLIITDLNLTYYNRSFEGVCAETAVIVAQEREESRSETAARLPAPVGIFGAQTLHWPRFYARPPTPLEF